jgi:hypothetical protein
LYPKARPFAPSLKALSVCETMICTYDISRITADMCPILDASVWLGALDARVVEKRKTIATTARLCAIARAGRITIGVCDLGRTRCQFGAAV